MSFSGGAICRSPLLVLLFLVLLLVLLSGCATLETARLVKEHPADLPLRVELTEVPFHPQEDYQCGPSSLAMLLNWSADAVTPDELVSQVYSPARKGSLQPDMITATRRHGRVAYPLTTMESLFTEIAAGNPVIVLQNLGLSWYPVWHYAVVVGYDLQEETVILRSGRIRREVLSMRLFERTWVRSGKWGMLVLPSDRLPAKSDEKTVLEAVVGLERASQWSAAAKAYEVALSRWPESLGALMGLGNSRYALGDLAGAEEAFRKAARSHPGEGAPFNNLAQVLSEQGQKEEAIIAARRAVELGGPLVETYRKTLEEIE